MAKKPKFKSGARSRRSDPDRLPPPFVGGRTGEALETGPARKKKPALSDHVQTITVIAFSAIGFSTSQTLAVQGIAEDLGHRWSGNAKTWMCVKGFCEALEERGVMMTIRRKLEKLGVQYIDLEN